MKAEEMVKRLKEPVSQDLIKSKPVGGRANASYVSWYDCCDLLDQRLGFASWSWEVKSQQQIGTRLHLTGTLTLLAEDKNISQDATGCEDLDCAYGDPSSNAESMAFRRACAKFGLGRDLWKKDRPATHGKKEVSREEWLKLKEARDAIQ